MGLRRSRVSSADGHPSSAEIFIQNGWCPPSAPRSFVSCRIKCLMIGLTAELLLSNIELPLKTGWNRVTQLCQCTPLCRVGFLHILKPLAAGQYRADRFLLQTSQASLGCSDHQPWCWSIESLKRDVWLSIARVSWWFFVYTSIPSQFKFSFWRLQYCPVLSTSIRLTLTKKVLNWKSFSSRHFCSTTSCATSRPTVN